MREDTIDAYVERMWHLHNTAWIIAVISVTSGIVHCVRLGQAFQDDEQTVKNLSASFGRGISVQLQRRGGRSREATSQASPKETAHAGRTTF